MRFHCIVHFINVFISMQFWRLLFNSTPIIGLNYSYYANKQSGGGGGRVTSIIEGGGDVPLERLDRVWFFRSSILAQDMNWPNWLQLAGYSICHRVPSLQCLRQTRDGACGTQQISSCRTTIGQGISEVCNIATGYTVQVKRKASAI